jgi:hypothetical protein
VKRLGLFIKLVGLFPQAILFVFQQKALYFYNSSTRSQPPYVRLERAWNFVQKFPVIFRIRAIYKNRFRSNWQNVIFSELLEDLTDNAEGLVPSTVVHGQDVLQMALVSDRPLVVCTVHSGLTRVVLKALAGQDVDIAFLAVKKPEPDWLSSYGLENNVEIVLAGSSALIALRNAFKRSKVVCGCVDFTVRQPGSFRHSLFVSDGLFAFARRLKANTVYCYCKVDKSGTVHTHFARPSLDTEKVDIDAHVRNFLSFIEGISEISPARQIVDSHSDHFRARMEQRHDRETRIRVKNGGQ